MTDETLILGSLEVAKVEALMCDADGTLFDSEPPAFEASAQVTNEMLVAWGVQRRFTPEELRQQALGRNFRSIALALAADEDVSVEPEEVERWVAAEREAAVAHLAAVLRPDPGVRDVLAVLGRSLQLSVVTSSARARLDACLGATSLDRFFPSHLRFSAEDSLPTPTSKPDPAIYRFAGEQTGVLPSAALAVEDSVTGARSAVAAGIPTIGMLQYVADDEREQRLRELGDAGVVAAVPSWFHLARLLARKPTSRAAAV